MCDACQAASVGVQWSKLDVAPFFLLQVLFQEPEKNRQGFQVTGERLAVVGKGERHQSAPGKPAVNATKYQSVRQFLSGRRRRGVRKRLIPISAAECLEPARSVKYRG